MKRVSFTALGTGPSEEVPAKCRH